MNRPGPAIGHVVLRETLEEYRKHAVIASHAKRLALELECLLTATRDSAAQARWWDSAHEALQQYQDDIDRLYPQDHISPLGMD